MAAVHVRVHIYTRLLWHGPLAPAGLLVGLDGQDTMGTLIKRQPTITNGGEVSQFIVPGTDSKIGPPEEHVSTVRQEAHNRKR